MVDEIDQAIFQSSRGEALDYMRDQRGLMLVI
jgi:hypothetical protein